MKERARQLAVIGRGAQPRCRQPLFFGLAVLISALLLGTSPAPAKPGKGKTLHLTAMVKKAKNDPKANGSLVTLALRSGSKGAGKYTAVCAFVNADEAACRNGGNPPRPARVTGVGSNLFITVTWHCSPSTGKCPRFATGTVSDNTSGKVLGTVTFKSTPPLDQLYLKLHKEKLRHQFPVVIHLK